MTFVYSLAIECKSNEFDGEFFFFLQFSSVGCLLPRSQQLIFHFQNSLMWIFFFRSSLVSAYEYLFLQFRAQKGASLVFSECDKSTELMYIFS